MKAIVTATFEIDVTDWYSDEGLSIDRKTRLLKDDLEDFSVFMPHFEYKNFKDVKIVLKD